MNSKITTRQLSIFIIIGFFITKIHALPALMANYVDESLYLPILINFLIDFLLLLVVISLNKSNETFLTLQQNTFGKVGGKIVCFFYFLFFMAKALVPIFEQESSIELTFYETQPLLITFLPYFAICFYFIIKGFKAILKSIEILLPFFIISIFVIVFLSLGEARFSSLLPLFSKSPMQILKSSLFTLIWFGDPIYILYFSGHLDFSKNYKKSVITSFIITAIFTTFFFILFYAVFDSISPRQYFAPIKMSKYSLTLSNIGRLDYLSSMILTLISTFITTLPLVFASLSLNDCFNFKNKFISPIIVVLLQFILAIITENDFLRSIKFISNYVVYFFIIMTYVLPFIIFLKAKRRKNV